MGNVKFDHGSNTAMTSIPSGGGGGGKTTSSHFMQWKLDIYNSRMGHKAETQTLFYLTFLCHKVW